ncbi:unnamed protein product [Arctogadus glacialis]
MDILTMIEVLMKSNIDSVVRSWCVLIVLSLDPHPAFCPSWGCNSPQRMELKEKVNTVDASEQEQSTNEVTSSEDSNGRLLLVRVWGRHRTAFLSPPVSSHL